MSSDPVSEVIRARRTTKFRVSPDQALPTRDDSVRSLVEELVDLGATAPHHFPCHSDHQQGHLDSPAPWRFYCLTGPACRRLMSHVLTLDGLVDKLAALLAAADGLILATWLPDPPSEPPPSRQPVRADASEHGACGGCGRGCPEHPPGCNGPGGRDLLGERRAAPPARGGSPTRDSRRRGVAGGCIPVSRSSGWSGGGEARRPPRLGRGTGIVDALGCLRRGVIGGGPLLARPVRGLLSGLEDDLHRLAFAVVVGGP